MTRDQIIADAIGAIEFCSDGATLVEYINKHCEGRYRSVGHYAMTVSRHLVGIDKETQDKKEEYNDVG
jgi:hypothetical protein